MAKTIAKWIFGASVLVALVALVYTALLGMLHGGAQQSLFGFSGAVVTSGSMQGTLEVDDLIITRARDSYAPGDVVTFEAAGGGLVTHRIIAEENGSFTTQGDANNMPDRDAVSPMQIHGTVVLRVPKAGALVQAIRTPLGLSVLLGLAVALLAGLLWPRKKEAATHETP